MTETERRDFYRVEDRIGLIRTPIERHQLSNNPYSEQYTIPGQATLISQLQLLDNENRDLLRQIDNSNRPMAQYLRNLDQKINHLANYLTRHDSDAIHKETVNLSEGGLSFYTSESEPIDHYLHLLMVLFPNYTTIAAIGIVKTCETIDEHPHLYRLGIEFDVLLEHDRKQVVRHIRRQGSQKIREQPQK